MAKAMVEFRVILFRILYRSCGFSEKPLRSQHDHQKKSGVGDRIGPTPADEVRTDALQKPEKDASHERTYHASKPAKRYRNERLQAE
jgi:hypothetical protein